MQVNKLRSSIQTLTKSAHPLGKLMDFLQEDVDSMQVLRNTKWHDKIDNILQSERAGSVEKGESEFAASTQEGGECHGTNIAALGGNIGGERQNVSWKNILTFKYEGVDNCRQWQPWQDFSGKVEYSQKWGQNWEDDL